MGIYYRIYDHFSASHAWGIYPIYPIEITVGIYSYIGILLMYRRKIMQQCEIYNITINPKHIKSLGDPISFLRFFDGNTHGEFNV